MKRDRFLGRVILVFGIAVLLYVVIYSAIEHRRRSKGPWQVTFAQEKSGAPKIIINQPTVGITNVQISFPGSSDAIINGVELHSGDAALRGPMTLTFGEARKTPFDVPMGKCVFLDTVFLPGTIVFEMYGHQVQLMPRVLTVDGVERPWIFGEKISLTNKPAAAKDGP
jgi:hypothetical protein